MSTTTTVLEDVFDRKRLPEGYLTFEEIAPRWAARIHRHGEHAFVKYARSLENFSLCVVGEAWVRAGGNGYYDSCPICEFYGNRFAGGKEPLKAIPGFVNHFKKHLRYGIAKR